MRKLETYVNEKLRVTKRTFVPYLIDILESKDKQEFDSNSRQLLEYLKTDNDLPMAELEDWGNVIRKRKLSEKYKNGNDIFLWVQLNERVFWGTWDNMYFMRWYRNDNATKCYANNLSGFNEFSVDYQELSESGGVFIITENEELMKQIGTLTKIAEPIT